MGERRYVRPSEVMDELDDELEDDDRKQILKPGQTMRVPLMLMDHILPSRRAAFTFVDGADGRNADGSIPGLLERVQQQLGITPGGGDRVQQAYDARSRRLSDAWRQPAASPPSSSQKFKTMEQHDAD